MGYDFEIVYRLRKHNPAVDALSHPPSTSLLAITSPKFPIITVVREANQSHPDLVALHNHLKVNPESLHKYANCDRLLFLCNRIILLADLSFRQQLLRESHSSLVGGHARIIHTFHHLSSNFFGKECSMMFNVMSSNVKFVSK